MILAAGAFIMLMVSILNWENEKPEPITNNSSGSTNLPTSSKEVTVDKEKYIYQVYIVNDLQKLKLFSNLESRNSSTKNFKEKNCRSLVNTSFYTEEGQHIGLFMTDGVKVRAKTNNSFFNGIVATYQNGQFDIGKDEKTNIKDAFQSGPLLLVDKTVQKIKISNDKPARRVVAAKNENGQAIFMIIYSKESNFLGPLLTNLPETILAINSKESLNITEAINLDGGSASAFITQNVKVSEISPIGSFFCETD